MCKYSVRVCKCTYIYIYTQNEAEKQFVTVSRFFFFPFLGDSL